MNLKTLAISSIFAATIAFCIPACAQTQSSSQTADFVRNASAGNAFEIESSKLALKKTSAKDVKNFAQMMVTDHTQLGDELKKTVASSGTGLTVAEKLAGDAQKTLDELTAAPTAAFDNLYVQAQSKAHDDAVSMFSDYAENGDNVDLKKFASNALPTLKKHQELVHNMTQAYMSTSQ
jgi:putative membrane protein